MAFDPFPGKRLGSRPGGPGGPGGPGAPPAVPVDGGLSVLLAAGGAYGLKKLNDKKKGKEV
jgi:hypothetical protein